MPTPKELEKSFWKALKSDRTMMLGLVGVDDGHTRPMTAQAEDEKAPIWFFTSDDNGVVKSLKNKSMRAIAAFSSKDHQLFASINGDIKVDTDRAVVERLWNPFVAAWYTGKDDPKLRLLRFDAEHAEIWLNENNLLAGLKMLIGIDPKKDYKDKVAEVHLT